MGTRSPEHLPLGRAVDATHLHDLVGDDLMAADKTTIAIPVWIQTMITIRKEVFHGCSVSQDTGS